MQRRLWLGGFAILLGCLAGQGFSADPANKEEMQKAYEKAATPAAEHKVLKQLEGKFECLQKASQPGAKETTGHAENTLVYGGLFIKSKVEGTCPVTGKEFRGVEYLGYDNTKKKYVNVWVNSLSSAIGYAEGIGDASGKVINFETQCADPLTGKLEKGRMILTIQDANRHRFQMFKVGAEGRDEPVFEVICTKK